ncbi:hypothetical protein C8Q76DRAFT_684792 [Earliella scabrosa]|nr:hypothetical protein C8Q76DRAFT_684792 [Earliella scabrosa]
MVILDEKTLMLPPPPPYFDPAQVSPPPFPTQSRIPPTLSTLPPHLLLRIVYETFSQGQVEKQRKVLYWLTMSLRQVNRSIYIACMHVLRSTYLPAYARLIRPPYTTDPFPHALPGSSSAASSHFSIIQRETRVLDLFIALKVREDVWADDSELHLEREESFKDLFDLMQPRARLEDLLRVYGLREGVVSVPSSSGFTAIASSSSSSAAPPLPFAALSVSFSPRAVGVVLSTRQWKKKIVEVPRTREETLEVSAKKLVRELRGWLAESPNHGVR